MKQFNISINKKRVAFLYFVTIACFSILYYIEWIKDDKCFVINDKLNPPPAEIIREKLCAAILSKPDELPYEETKLKELINTYLRHNKKIAEQFSKSNAIVANAVGQYIPGPVKEDGGLWAIRMPIMYHNLDLTFSSERFKTMFVPDDAGNSLYQRMNELLHTADSIESQESNKLLPKGHINRNLEKQINLFKDFKNHFNNTKKFKQVIDDTIDDSFLDPKMFQGIQPFIDLVIEEIDNNEVVLDKAEQSLDYYWERLPDKNTPFIRYIDFLYFSIISATTTGYGDIIPNSTKIRMFVSVEILLCLFMFGTFLFLLGKKNYIWVFPKKLTEFILRALKEWNF